MGVFRGFGSARHLLEFWRGGFSSERCERTNRFRPDVPPLLLPAHLQGVYLQPVESADVFVYASVCH